MRERVYMTLKNHNQQDEDNLNKYHHVEPRHAVPRRKSIRLRGYDYSQAGAYFVTICTQNRACLFGEIVDGEMNLNEYGCIVMDEWIKTTEIRNEIELDEFIVMPNHFHAIVVITCRGTARRAPTKGRAPTMERFGKPVAGSLPTIIRAFKSAVTKRINEARRSSGTKLWQRNFWEHIVRNENELNRIRQYIKNNPKMWAIDKLNAARGNMVMESSAPYGKQHIWMV